MSDLSKLNGESLRDGIFAMHTSRFGSVTEMMVKRLLNSANRKSQFHDLFDEPNQRRIEVKFSRVMKKWGTKLTEQNVLQCIADSTTVNRFVSFGAWCWHDFDCNIQQIKRHRFDVLYYGLLFSDCIKIFRIESSEIGSSVGYSDKQHDGNEGEGQFHVTQRTLRIHLDNYYYKQLSYDELLALLT